MGRIHVGTCSWTEKTMVDLWYPKGVNTSEKRLRYYASKFDTVEVDSPYYAIPKREWAEAWAKRTPDDFVFNVKAFGLMTGHEAGVQCLTPTLARHPFVQERGRITEPSRELVDASFEEFLDSIEPLREAGKLGGILMQYPPYFTATTPENEKRGLAQIEDAAERLMGYRVLVEFRHPSWVDPRHIDSTLAFLAERDLSYVSVDNPQFPDGRTMPPLTVATNRWAYVRMHGRNADTWYKKGGTAADRFDYLYTTEELEEWVGPIKQLAENADETFVMFNNNRYDYAQRNAAEIATILGDAVTPPAAVPGETPSLF